MDERAHHDQLRSELDGLPAQCLGRIASRGGDFPYQSLNAVTRKLREHFRSSRTS